MASFRVINGEWIVKWISCFYFLKSRLCCFSVELKPKILREGTLFREAHTVPLECTYPELLFECGHTFRFCLKNINAPSLAITNSITSSHLSNDTRFRLQENAGTLFSNNTNITIRMYLSRAFIWVVTPLGLVYKKMNSLQ